ncbi:phosphoribosylglycinamide formyltransferase [Anaplasmataceae bacterium AB001_6]|nr:phosphoribosylglycinamide formyltransferase [Anaplasmataceae bacterium AB001_6]
MKKKVAVFISGTGSNLLSLLKSCRSNQFPAKIVLVVSNKSDAFGINYAKDFSVDTLILESLSMEVFEKKVQSVLDSNSIEIICLAGFMKILSADFVEKWKDKIINIHPSILPSFKGLNAQKQAHNYGVKVIGCTVHYVTANVDAGQIITQAITGTTSSESYEIKKKKILSLEHICYSKALKKVCLQEEDSMDNSVIIVK